MQQQGGSQYGVPPPPDLTPFSSPGAAPRPHMLGISGPDPLQQQPQPPLAEAASPISSRPPPPGTSPRPLSTNFEELIPAVPGNFPDDEALAAAGEEVERGSAPGNRWPRQETLALLKIRSEMDAAFREATLKGPLWEDVSRRLAELGYKRSAKKCKEKFENVHKYYKRTKEGRAGRQDGKSYRFFSQLEALHSSSSSSAAAPSPTTAPALPTSAAAANPTPTAPTGMSTGMVGPSPGRIQPPPMSAVAPPPITMPTRVAPELTPTTGANPPGISAAATAGISFSSNTSSSFSSESDDEETEEAGGSREGWKRRRGGGSGRSRKMKAFFEGLMKQVMERQEAMQQRFLEAIEKREQDRMIREEAWRRQEMARLNREHEVLAQERAMAASRDAAIISYIQKISGQTIQLPTMPAATAIALAPPQQPSVAPAPQAPPPQQTQQLQSQQQQQQKSPTLMQPSQQKQQELHQHHQSTEIGRHQVSSSSELVPVPEPQEPVGTGSFEPVSSSRWPKAEVHALIKMRSELDSRYQETGPKGPLWEEISTEMKRLGYNRSAKRCKEKWENINKYFKKVKESNKRRPEDSKTCPYFHQLDALYRKKHHSSGGGGGSSGGGSAFGIQQQQEQEANPDPNSQDCGDVPTIIAQQPPQAPPPQPPPQTQQPPADTENKKGKKNNGNNNRNGGNSEGGGGSHAIQIQTSNGGLPPSFFEESSGGSGTKMKKPEDIVKELMDQRQQQAAMEDYDKMEEPDSDDIDQDDDDEDDEDGKMQYKIQFQRPKVGGGGGTASTASTTSGSFLAMVQ